VRRLLPLAVLAVAFVAGPGGLTPRSSAADCVPLRVVFYAANDWLRLAQRLAASSSPCVEYFISVPPLADKITPRPDQARRFRALGPNFHGLAESNVEGWTGWVSSTGGSWYAAGVEARKQMAANGYEVAAGDSWALNELSSAVRVGANVARANMREFARGLYEGDGVPVRGVVFTAGLSSATNEVSVYQSRLQEWYEDAAFWTEMQTYVSDWAQEEYGDIRNYAVAGADQATRRAALQEYLLHPLALARAEPGTAAVARAVLESTFTPIANAAWEYDQSFGYTSVSYELMADYVSAQVDALRTAWPRFGFAWAPRNSTGMAPADFTAQTNAIIDRLAAAIADASQACTAPWCTAVLDGSWLNTGWRSFTQWKLPLLAFTTPLQSIGLGVPSAPLTVELRTNTGLAYGAGPAVAVTLTSSSPAGTFSTSPDGPWTPTLTVTLASGTSSVTAYYRDSQPGTATLTASAPGKAAGTQAVTVGPPPDTAPPDTRLVVVPAKVVRSTAVSLSFASEVGARFECSLDGSPFTACSGSVAYVNLKQGRHTLAVRAVDAAGNVDPTPARVSWVTDSLPPDTRILGRALKGRVLARFWFSAKEPRVRFECSLDGAPFIVCKSPFGYFPLSRGRHTFRVRGTDAAGNAEKPPASVSWRVR
jgi:hypothetical protein